MRVIKRRRHLPLGECGESKEEKAAVMSPASSLSLRASSYRMGGARLLVNVKMMLSMALTLVVIRPHPARAFPILQHPVHQCRFQCGSRPRPLGWPLRMANPEATRGILRDKGGDVNLDFQFFDEAVISARGGTGGHGAATFKTVAHGQRGPPNGGSGGRGGDVVLECVEWLNTLGDLRGSASFAAERGVDGEARFKNGAEAPHTIVPVPPGTVVRCAETEEVIGELRRAGQKLVIAKGGLGGRGNASSKGGRGTAPRASAPLSGEKARVKLELKLVADVGLVGVPNAGKSTLLAAASNAKPKICDYPFTTLVPNLGVCEPSSLGFDGPGMVLADIPGLLEGAHRGVGLGRAFLRHVERCRLIIHVVNGASPDPVGDFNAINQELALFSDTLAEKPQVIILNKIDMAEVAEGKEKLMEALQRSCNHKRIMAISAAGGDGVAELMRRTRKLLTSLEIQDAQVEAEAEAQRAALGDEGGYEENPADEGNGILDAEGRKRVFRDGNGDWRVSDARLLRLAKDMNSDYYDAPKRLLHFMEGLGITEELLEEGANMGEVVKVGEHQVLLGDPSDSTL